MSIMLSRNGSRIFNLININYVPSRNSRARPWVRKPLGSPTAKSKLFRVPQKPNLPMDETEEIRRLHNIYFTQMKSLRVYFYEQSLKQAESGESAQLKLKQEDEEHARLMEENRLENEKTAKKREERWTVEAEKTRERVISSLVKKEQQEELYKSKLGEFIEMQKSIPIISKENIEKAIEEALVNPVDFNYAIDLEGYVYRGKETSIDKISPENRERLCN
uniref:Small ribosomal subunit protein mS26 n=1 Tax=Eubosmina coregoni TaxID=186181 RepID=A0A4Y7LN83_9CRUS|nr:EOG090X0FQ9 [Eubosmina coregoni]SVE70121.1 EOG090X0FQ9 [Eubosmina coregoni]